MALKADSARSTEAVENYLKVTALLEAEEGTVTTSALAARVGVTAASASWMAKHLAAEGLVEHTPYRGIRLTPRGRAFALRVVRRHRLVETYLHEVLGFAWDEVHDEAERLEHCISDRLEERIAEALGHPDRDPHGDPIPPRHGRHRERPDRRLDQAPTGSHVRLERVSDRDPAILRHVSQLGLSLGAEFVIDERGPFGGPVWISYDGNRLPLGRELVQAMFVSVPRRHDRDEDTC